MLGDVGDRDHQRAARHVRAPGVVHLHVRRLPREVQPPVRELDDPRPVRLEPGLEVGLLAGAHGMHVARRQEVGAAVVGEEDLAGVEAGRRGKGPAARGALVVRDLRRVVRVEGEEVEPAGVAADRGEQDHLLEVGDRRRRVPRGEGQRPVGDRGALGEAARAPAVDRLDQREGTATSRPAGKGGG